ncbi:MAG: S8 family peptidase [Spirochaetaceae bacterium]|nr:S8 family peptidase [Spirochaetaceae bacterium]
MFSENKYIPAVGKIIVKPEAIAKSYKPNDLCRDCPIIGNDDLGEIFIKVTRNNILKTIQNVKEPPSERFKANLTTIKDIAYIAPSEKISEDLTDISNSGKFGKIRSRIKIKCFDFDDDYDNSLISNYVTSKIEALGLDGRDMKVIKYGENIQYIKLSVTSYQDIVNISSINGIKTIDFFQEYSLLIEEYSKIDIEKYLDEDHVNSDTTIGIIDSGISGENSLLAPYIMGREEYVSPIYQNPRHATFIASMIQFGNKLNGIEGTDKKRFKFLDIVAIPNGDQKFGPVDTVTEDELMEIIEEIMTKYSFSVKIWNLSLGIVNKVCDTKMSDLGIFLDYIQDKYQVQIFVSSGNLEHPFRTWPPQATMGERDRIISPADSVRAITVGSLALFDSAISMVKKDEPSPFSRRGPGANYNIKPDIVDYGGNLDIHNHIKNLGVRGLDPQGNVIEGVGTSYATPRGVQKYALVYDELLENDLLLSKAMTIHSARMNSRGYNDKGNIAYYGFGLPAVNSRDILLCSENEITLVFKQRMPQGNYLELFDFPYPKSLIRNGKYFGEICMTLAYNPLLDQRFGKEYCRVNMDASFGTYKFEKDGKLSYKGCVPPETTWDEKYEEVRVKNGFKWSPVKSYYRNIKKGLDIANGWKIRIDMTVRNKLSISPQEFVLIITIKDNEGNDIYSEIVNGLKEKGYIVNNLETRQQIRQRT